MNILPAIDIRGGKCVRLYQGDYAQETVYYEDPTEVASMWEKQGAKYLHVVDLDGAKDGELRHLSLVKNIIEKTSLKVELGGGVRSLEDVQRVLDAGVSYPIVGTQALEDEIFLSKLSDHFKSSVVIGIDARDGYVATRGWLDDSKVRAVDFAQKIDQMGFERIIFTDIATDGAMSGPNLSANLNILEHTRNVSITVSGGVSSLGDISSIIEKQNPRFFGVIIGKALYDQKIDLKEALDLI
ncbi:1-(5-phosphoribosyl)-5-[(5-phosphoribosylamino)methylideneamino]imidazole-4-carboxamide isomerase [PVC group bacterium (ex Bugula neritina AB1)]|nr:1-(5-phosphoribosyl)-5-[(5-phosphoribosylamino)methylideneamino]imidazole-4-carboxamide isomerase [PVC group bacterium (ex Bugula neritina AB1)]